MFKKFTEKESVTTAHNVKSSVQKGIRNRVQETMPHIKEYIDKIMPKKEAMRMAKCHDHIELIIGMSGEPVFFRQGDGPYYPSLKLLHKYPFLLPIMQVDKGAIRFVLSGANIMCPGLTSPGAKMTEVPTGTPVAIMAEGKQHAIGIGITKMSSEKILDVNKGIGVDLVHYLGDGLFQIQTL